MPGRSDPDRRKLLQIYSRAVNSFKYREGVIKIEKALRQRPDLADEEVLCKLGLLYDHWALKQSEIKRRELEDKALALYRRALRLNPDSARAWWGMGRVWWHRKNRKALTFALKAYRIKKRKKEPVGLYPQHIGLIYEFLNDHRKAERWLLRGARENPGDYGSYLNLVVFYNARNDVKQAGRHAMKLKELFAKEPHGFRATPWGKRINKIITEALNRESESKK